MELILLQKVKNLGDLGETVKVRAGFGRNYLLPKGLALPATPENLKVFEERKAELVKKSQASLGAAKVRAEQIAGKTITVLARAADEGHLYGSVGPAEIARAAEAAGVDVHKSEIDMPEGAIRVTGTHVVSVQLHTEVTAELTVVVEEEKG